MSVRIRRQFDIRKFSKRVRPTKAMMLRAGNRHKKEVKDRTRGGLSQNRRSFAPYSAAYARQKGQTNVDLWLTGAMQRGYKVIEVDRHHYRLGWTDPELEARGLAHQRGTGRLPARRWLGVSDTFLKSQRTFLGQLLKKA
jgi:hypothetical protein